MLVGVVNVKLIISSHGFMIRVVQIKPYEFSNPHGLTLHSFVPIGNIFYYSNKIPKKVYEGIEKPLEIFASGINFPNYVIKSDETNIKNFFHSGIKRCDTNEFILNIDDLFRSGITYLFLYDIILHIADYCKTHIKDITYTEIYLLFCLEGISNDYSTDILTDMFSKLKI